MRATRIGVTFTLALLGCDTGSRDEPATASSAAQSSSTTAAAASGTSGATPATSPAAGAGTARLSPTDAGVQVGLQLLRAQLTPAQAVSAWTTEGVTPQQAKDLLGRLPLTAGAPAAGFSPTVATIADAWGRTTDISLVVPANAAPTAGYPVVVFLHGLGGNSSNVSGVANAIGNEFIVVAPTALAPPASITFEDASPVVPLNGAFQHWWVYRDHAFAMRALDWVRERYFVDTNRILLFGASMGGFGCWNIGLRFHDRFAGLVEGAGGISRIEYAIPPDALTRGLLENGRMVPSWFTHGDMDTVVPVSFARATNADLNALGAPHTYREVAGGGHDTSAFQSLFPEILSWITAARRDPSPTTVTHRAIGNYQPGAFWVSLKGPNGTVQASVSGQAITVTTGNGATGATVYLDPTLVDVTQAVTVTVDGATLSTGVPTPSLEAVAQSFARTRDPQLTYVHRVTTP